MSVSLRPGNGSWVVFSTTWDRRSVTKCSCAVPERPCSPVAAPSAATGSVCPVATPGAHSRRTGHEPKYIPYEDVRPARREHAPDSAPRRADVACRGTRIRPQVRPPPTRFQGTRDEDEKKR
ncbi:hypothetical protein GCM10027075_59810 [Streptomyces heilongjiangensis]